MTFSRNSAGRPRGRTDRLTPHRRFIHQALKVAERKASAGDVEASLELLRYFTATLRPQGSLLSDD